MQLYKRNYGAVVYLVDVDGKLVTDDTVYVEVGGSGNPNACVLSLCSENEELSDIIATWGKTNAVFSSQELGTPDYTITIGDYFVDIVGETATPDIEDLPTVTVVCDPVLPHTFTSQGNIVISKSDGASWTEEEIISLKINGKTAAQGSSITWTDGETTFRYTRNSAGETATIEVVPGGSGQAVCESINLPG